MRRASNFFKHYHKYHSRLPNENIKDDAHKILHHFRAGELDKIKPVPISWKATGKMGVNLDKPEKAIEWKLNPIYTRNGWLLSEGDHVGYISGRLIKTRLQEKPMGIIYLGPKYESCVKLPTEEIDQLNSNFAAYFALDLALKIAILNKWRTIQIRTDNLGLANLFTSSSLKKHTWKDGDSPKKDGDSPKKAKLIEDILSHKANIHFNVAYVNPKRHISPRKRRNFDSGIVNLNRLAQGAQLKLLEEDIRGQY